MYVILRGCWNLEARMAKYYNGGKMVFYNRRTGDYVETEIFYI